MSACALNSTLWWLKRTYVTLIVNTLGFLLLNFYDLVANIHSTVKLHFMWVVRKRRVTVTAAIWVHMSELVEPETPMSNVVRKADLQKFREIYGVAHIIVNEGNQVKNFFVRWLLSHGCQ